VTTPPARPKIFHITHVDNLRSIVAADELLSDARRARSPMAFAGKPRLPSLLRPTSRLSSSDRSGTPSQGSRTMIEVTRGDILKADAEALVNTVNCVGVMGRGLAAQFKRAYPKNFNVYQQACKRHEVQPGRMLIVETGRLANPR
jgi:hypothetical protein